MKIIKKFFLLKNVLISTADKYVDTEKADIIGTMGFCYNKAVIRDCFNAFRRLKNASSVNRAADIDV